MPAVPALAPRWTSDLWPSNVPDNMSVCTAKMEKYTTICCNQFKGEIKATPWAQYKPSNVEVFPVSCLAQVSRQEWSNCVQSEYRKAVGHQGIGHYCHTRENQGSNQDNDNQNQNQNNNDQNDDNSSSNITGGNNTGGNVSSDDSNKNTGTVPTTPEASAGTTTGTTPDASIGTSTGTSDASLAASLTTAATGTPTNSASGSANTSAAAPSTPAKPNSAGGLRFGKAGTLALIGSIAMGIASSI